MLFANYMCENSTELHYGIAEGIITIQCSLLCRHSSIFEQKPVFTSIKSSCPSSAVTYGIMQCLVIGVMISLQTFFLKSSSRSYLMVQIMIIGWMQQHCPSKICVGLCGAHVCLPALPRRNNTWDLFLMGRIW
jgi:hypothetical protein